MECCTIYTIPKKCITEGNSFTSSYEYNRPDGSPISLKGSTITLDIIRSIDGEPEKTISIPQSLVHENVVTPTVSTIGLSGRYIQKLVVSFPDGKRMVDRGELMVYGKN